MSPLLSQTANSKDKMPVLFPALVAFIVATTHMHNESIIFLFHIFYYLFIFIILTFSVHGQVNHNIKAQFTFNLKQN